MSELVRLKTRPSRDGKTFKYQLEYIDENGKRCRMSLGHTDRRKAEQQRAQKERELRMDVTVPVPMKLSVFLEDSLERTGDQVRESTKYERKCAMEHFISVTGNIDLQSVTFRHGEQFRQECLDGGNKPATVSKKLRAIKRLFQLAVERRQLYENPLRFVKVPKWTKRKVEIYGPDECERLLRAGRESLVKDGLRWDLLFHVALETGMRRGELLNAIWSDIDFGLMTIEVAPKDDTPRTWPWLVKDTDRCTLPLTEEAVVLLAEHQSNQPEGYPYVFVPPARYDRIQELRRKGKWTLIDSRLKVINNFDRKFKKILKRAAVRRGRFQDLRSTALTDWIRNGVDKYDLMRLAGHGYFNTTCTFYLAVTSDLQDRARAAKGKGMSKILARAWHAPTILSKSG